VDHVQNATERARDQVETLRSPKVIRVTTSERTGIRLTNLTKSYGVVKAVRGIDLTINPGETLALLGPNGAGKTTTIDMMLV